MLTHPVGVLSVQNSFTWKLQSVEFCAKYRNSMHVDMDSDCKNMKTRSISSSCDEDEFEPALVVFG